MCRGAAARAGADAAPRLAYGGARTGGEDVILIRADRGGGPNAGYGGAAEKRRRQRRGEDGGGGDPGAEGRAVIAPPAGVKVLVATKPIDFRKGANGLAALIKDEMRADPFSGVVYVFRAKRADRIKLLYWDGSGVVLVAKTLEQGVFRWPKIQNGTMRWSASQLSALIDEMDWARVYNVRRTRVPIAAH